MALLDAGKCLGHYPATLAMEKAIEKAKAAGHCLAAIGQEGPGIFSPARADLRRRRA